MRPLEAKSKQKQATVRTRHPLRAILFSWLILFSACFKFDSSSKKPDHISIRFFNHLNSFDISHHFNLLGHKSSSWLSMSRPTAQKSNLCPIAGLFYWKLILGVNWVGRAQHIQKFPGLIREPKESLGRFWSREWYNEVVLWESEPGICRIDLKEVAEIMGRLL